MKILDTVALKRPMPELGLPAGLVGVLVEEWEPGTYEVEFADLNGKTYAKMALNEADLLPLHHSLEKQAA
ncbi:MAG: DUF4926 domain-containing protein [Parasulfuritortus sp.]|nr:DUF4926 domain-containing protein [Parasulfuritortus sp.]